VQVCTYVMKVGYRCVRAMCDELAAFMQQHRFRTLADFKGHSLQYFTTHYDLVQRQAEARGARTVPAQRDGQPVKTDQEWRGDDFVRQTDALARG
jgi:hypothetical protein